MFEERSADFRGTTGQHIARKRHGISTAALFLAVTVFALPAAAQEKSVGGAAPTSEKDLESKNEAYAIENPFALIARVPIENQFDAGAGPDDSWSYAFRPRPIIPFKLTDDLALLTRATFNLRWVEDNSPGNNVFGLGDTDVDAYFTPRKAVADDTFVYGAGAIVRLDTSTDDKLGGNKWGAGPAVALAWQPARLDAKSGFTFTLFVNHLFGWQGNEGQLDQTYLQPIVSYTFEGGTSIALDTQSTYDWKPEDWTVPINLTVSQLVKLWDPVVITLGGRYYAETPRNGPDWGGQLSFTFLLPNT